MCPVQPRNGILSLILLNIFFIKFWSNFRFTEELRSQYREFLYVLASVSPVVNILHDWGTFGRK